jgi:hypothetical protein
MTRVGRLVRTAVNPLSTGVTRWWCQSAVRRLLTGYGPPARRRLIRHGETALPGGQAEARTAAAGGLSVRDDHGS